VCYHLSTKINVAELEKRFEAAYDAIEAPTTYHHVSGFAYPNIPVITSEEPNRIKLFQWGLIPAWTKSKADGEKFRANTLNARSETIFKKPSFRSVTKKRCLVLVDGFYEWRDYNKKKYPYFIHLKNNEPFAMGGIYENWADKETGEILDTFSIVTLEANPLMAKIHNSKLRMPLILPKETERLWIEPKVDKDFIGSLFKQFPENEMAAHTISKLITSRKENSNVPDVYAEEAYSELPAL
jgi:putative SOS response-associated peptidase YedK